MTKKVLSEIQTKTAEILGMERGKIGSKAVRLTPRQYRAVEAEKETVKQKHKEQTKTLGNEYKEARETLKKSGSATQKDYQELKKKYEHLKSEVNTDKPKKKALSIKELKKCKELGMNEQEITTFSTLKRDTSTLKRDTEKLRNLANATRMKTEHSKITNPHLNTVKHLELLLAKEEKQQQSKLRKLQLKLKQRKRTLENYLKPNSKSLALAKRRIKTRSKSTRGRM
jgi:uncharacterized membrane-anchored protein YhcB (DUF1043 family)